MSRRRVGDDREATWSSSVAVGVALRGCLYDKLGSFYQPVLSEGGPVSERKIELVNKPTGSELDFTENRGYTIDTGFTPSTVETPPSAPATPAESPTTDAGTTSTED